VNIPSTLPIDAHLFDAIKMRLRRQKMSHRNDLP